jgi:hypothetical protein
VSLTSPFQGAPVVEGSEKALPDKRVILLVNPNTNAIHDESVWKEVGCVSNLGAIGLQAGQHKGRHN